MTSGSLSNGLEFFCGASERDSELSAEISRELQRLWAWVGFSFGLSGLLQFKSPIDTLRAQDEHCLQKQMLLRQFSVVPGPAKLGSSNLFLISLLCTLALLLIHSVLKQHVHRT